jgi:preprotein translocase subunit SecF
VWYYGTCEYCISILKYLVVYKEKILLRKLPLNMFLGDKTMEIIIALLVFAGLGAVWYYNRNTGFDKNKDGKVDFSDVKPVVENTVQAVVADVKKAADVNKDGAVTAADVKVVAKRAAAGAKKAATKAKPAVKKPRTPKLKVAK